VFYAGRVVEQGPTARVLTPPYHPYTRLLLSSIPELKQGWLEHILRSREAAAGIARDVRFVDVGMSFFQPVPFGVADICDREDPPQRRPSERHVIACHRTVSDLAPDLWSG
jgi:peptide/nickel transport system ATP-binding protein